MKKILFFFRILLAVASLLGYNLYQAQARLQDASKRLDAAEAQAKKARKRRQAAQKQWDEYNRAELRVIAAQMQPTLHLVNNAGNEIRMKDPLPPVNLRMAGSLDQKIRERLPDEFRYEVTKGRVSIYRRGNQVSQETRTDGDVNCASMNTKSGDVVVCEALEVVRIDKAGKQTPVKPKNPSFRFFLR